MDQSLSITLVTETYPPEINGVAMTLQRLAEGLCARGHRVQLVRPRRAGESSTVSEQGCPTVVQQRGMRIPMYPDLRLGFPARRRLLKLWRQQRPDVLYIATEGPLGWSALRAAEVLDIPVISGFHTRFDQYAGQYGLGLLTSVVERYLRNFHRRSRCTLAPTEALCHDLSTRGYGPTAVLPRGVDTQRFSPQRRSPGLRQHWGVSERDLALICVGRVAPEKGINQVLEAWRAIAADRPGTRLILVGDGPLARGLENAEPRPLLAGSRTGVDLAEHYASADLFLFPSRSETFGNVTLEAMASSLPVVAYDYAAAKLHIDHGTSGILVPFDAPGDFVTAARRAAGDLLRLGSMGRQARRHVETLDWSGVLNRFETLLRRHVVVAEGC